MICVLGTVFAALVGLAFGSFLNVCLSRWPEGESIVRPRSYCHDCGHTLAWWENVPLASWVALRGRCRSCKVWIGWRYPLVELAVGLLWAQCWLKYAWPALLDGSSPALAYGGLETLGFGAFLWLLVGLSVLDAEYLWLPDVVTLPGIGIGVVFSVLRARLEYPVPDHPRGLLQALLECAIAVLVAAGLLLLLRWIYWLIRRREGLGLGDVKLIALLAALLAFSLGVLLGSVVAVVLLALPEPRTGTESWAFKKLPLGTFLCIGGIISALWGKPILDAYLHWAGF